jgi:plasmanylethanolamine desaturase
MKFDRRPFFLESTSFERYCMRLSVGHPRSAFIRVAQKMHLVISPEHHWVHHREDQIVRYCVINGWANYLCDRLHVWRRLEWLIRMLTGAVPRRDDLDWQRRYEETGTLVRASQPEAGIRATRL